MTAAERPVAASVALHWAVALGVTMMLAFGYWISTLPRGEGKTEFVQTHKSFGMLVFALALARLAWRARTGFPAPLATGWERRAARISHWLLLAATIAMPVSGVVRSLSYARPVSVFGVPVIPQLLAVKNEALNEAAGAVHDACALMLVCLILLHTAGALKHHLFDRDATLSRMTPRLGRSPRGAP